MTQGEQTELKFKCKQCGICCKRIRNRQEYYDEQEKEFIKNYFYGKLPVVQLEQPEKMTFPIWPWEARQIIEKAKQKGIDPKIKPLRAIFDLEREETIVTSYFIDSDECTFLDNEDKCIAYEQRPSICRQFPLQNSTEFAECPGTENINVNTAQQLGSYEGLLNYFGESFKSAEKNDNLVLWQNNLILAMLKSKKIRAAINYPYNFLLKRIQQSIEKGKIIDFDEFLIREEIVTKEEMEKIKNK